jgi:MbtH protein
MNALGTKCGEGIRVATGLLAAFATLSLWNHKTNRNKRETDMTNSDQNDKNTYNVVVNDEEQYSIWPADREILLGWKTAGKSGTKEACLAYINDVWTDMRPLSLRKKINAQAS